MSSTYHSSKMYFLEVIVGVKTTLNKGNCGFYLLFMCSNLLYHVCREFGFDYETTRSIKKDSIEIKKSINKSRGISRSFVLIDKGTMRWLYFRMLGIKANIVVKTIRIEENGKESMFFASFKFKNW